MKRWCVVIGRVVLVLLLWSEAGLTAAYAEEGSKKAVSIQAEEKDTKAVPTGEDSWVELELRGWAPTLRGTVQSSATSMIGHVEAIRLAQGDLALRQEPPDLGILSRYAVFRR